jgi:hypothetical protein
MSSINIETDDYLGTPASLVLGIDRLPCRCAGNAFSLNGRQSGTFIPITILQKSASGRKIREKSLKFI